MSVNFWEDLLLYLTFFIPSSFVVVLFCFDLFFRFGSVFTTKAHRFVLRYAKAILC